MSGAGKTVLLLVNKDTTVLNFRRELPEAFLSAGYRVTVALPPGDRTDEIAAMGVTVIQTPMKKDAVTPLGDLRLLLGYCRLIRRVKPLAVLTYTVKPNIYGALSAGSTPVLATVTGRGQALAHKGFLRTALLFLYRRAFRRVTCVYFQNEADRAFFAAHRIRARHAETLPGSGVNLERFSYEAGHEEGPVAFAFISRLLPEKGVDTYVEVARRVRAQHPDIVFHVCGFGDAATERRMAALAAEGVIVFHGRMRDVRPLLRRVRCVIHPGNYPEGMSNILLEAAATGRAVIASDLPGFREAVLDGESGFLVPPRDAAGTVAAVERFLALTPAERSAMGLCGRRHVEAHFDRRTVTARYLSAVDALASGLSAPRPAEMSHTT